MVAKKVEKATDPLNKEKLISREFDNGSRDLLQKQLGHEQQGAHTGYDRDGKISFSYGRDVYETSGYTWEQLEEQKLKEASEKSVQKDAHEARAAELRQKGLTEEAERESLMASRLNSEAEALNQEARDIRMKAEAEQTQLRQRQMDLERDR